MIWVSRTIVSGLLISIALSQNAADAQAITPLGANQSAASGNADRAPTATAASASAWIEKEEFLSARTQLLSEMEAVRRNPKNRTPESKREALNLWRRQNAKRYEALNDQAVRVARSHPLVEIPMVREVTIPANATPELEAFLVEGARLRNEQAGIKNQLRQSPAAAEQALQTWGQQNLGRLDIQQRRAATQSTQNTPKTMRIPAAPAIPQGASAELRAFLVERHTLLRERAAVEEQNAHVTDVARAAAMEQWQQNNAIRFQDLAEKARLLSDQ